MSQQTGIISCFLIKIANGAKAYHYEVKMYSCLPDREEKKVANKEVCISLLKTAQKKTKTFSLGGEVVFDGRAVLFTPAKIPSGEVNIVIKRAEADEIVQIHSNQQAFFRLQIQQTESSHELDLNNIDQYVSKTSVLQEDHTLRTFLELALSQHAIDRGLYTSVGKACLYQDNQEHQMGNGIVFRSGIHRSTRVVQNFGSPMPAVVLDCHTSAFFVQQSLIKTLLQLNNNIEPNGKDEWDKMFQIFRGVRVTLTYNKKRVFAIGKFTEMEIGQLPSFTNEQTGCEVTIPQYYNTIKFNEYNVRVSHLNFPGVIGSFASRKIDEQPEIFPMECLEIVKDQKLNLEKTKMIPNLQTKLHKVNVIEPAERRKQIKMHANQIGLFTQSNKILQAFGIHVEESSDDVPLAFQQSPTLDYGDQNTIKAEGNASWKATNSKFIKSALIAKWTVLFPENESMDVKSFVTKYRQVAEQKGITFEADVIPSKFSGDLNFVEAFKYFEANSIQFVLLIDSLASETHDTLKYCEARWKIVTQHITLEKVMSIVHENKIKTLENIINKSNMKLNGLNYVPLIPKNSSKYSLESGKILVIGLDVAHPKHFAAANEVADPSVVGICANMVENKHNFVGDYFFQTARQESIDKQQLKQRIHWILRSLQKNRPDTCPQLVVVLRDGLSEGQFKMAIQDELAAIKEACQEMRLKNLKFVLLIATKRHSKRIFALQNGIKNVAPGSVVEEKYVREDVVEWFQLPHKAIKGTAQAVQYALLVNELNIPTSDLQAFLTTQCFNHQIVTSAVSLPEPVFQADELAKRGYNNFETMRRLEPGLIPIENKKEGAKEEKRKQQQVDVEALSLLLSYKDSKLEGTRFTA